MRSLLVILLAVCGSAIAQDFIPAGTVIPLALKRSLNSRKAKIGDLLIGRVMQDIPVSNTDKVPAGALVEGHIVALARRQASRPASITIQFDQLRFDHKSIPVTTNLRAVASAMEVEAAQIPPSGPDRGTPWAWATRNLIGGEVAYGEGGPVADGTKTVGRALADGVLAPVRANPKRGCRGELFGNRRPQALWVFSSDACGVYGIPELQISHAGRTALLGQFTLTLEHGDVMLRGGAGLLLRVSSTAQ